MQLPLELIRQILEYAAAEFEYSQFLDLRTLCSLLDQEICLSLFSTRCPSGYRTKSPWNGIRKSRWSHAPDSMIERYLWFRVTHFDTEPGPFMDLLLPVFECYPEQISNSQIDTKVQDAQLQECLQFFMHQHWSLAWVITANERPNRITWADRFETKLEYRDEVEYQFQGQSQDMKMMQRLHSNVQFLKLLLAIRRDDSDAVLESFAGSLIGPDDMNICFGTTLIGAAIKFGTCSMVRLLLRSIKKLPTKCLCTYLRLTRLRGNEGRDMAYMLLYHLAGFKKRSFTLIMLNHAIDTDDADLFATIWEWFVSARDFQDKLYVIEWLPRPNYMPPTVLEYFKECKPPQKRCKSRLKARMPEMSEEHAKALQSIFIDPDLSSRRKKQNFMYVKEFKAPSILFDVVTNGHVHWADWMLWAGADPRHLKGEAPLLDFAWVARKRTEVAELLAGWGWDLEKLEATPIGAWDPYEPEDARLWWRSFPQDIHVFLPR